MGGAGQERGDGHSDEQRQRQRQATVQQDAGAARQQGRRRACALVQLQAAGHRRRPLAPQGAPTLEGRAGIQRELLGVRGIHIHLSETHEETKCMSRLGRRTKGRVRLSGTGAGGSGRTHAGVRRGAVQAEGVQGRHVLSKSTAHRPCPPAPCWCACPQHVGTWLHKGECERRLSRGELCRTLRTRAATQQRRQRGPWHPQLRRGESQRAQHIHLPCMAGTWNRVPN